MTIFHIFVENGKKMETITIEIDKRTSAGKAFLEVLNLFSKNSKDVKIKEKIKKTPNTQVLKTFKEIDEEKNLVDTHSHKDLLDKLYS